MKIFKNLKKKENLKTKFEDLREKSFAIYCTLADILEKQSPDNVPSRIEQLTGRYLNDYADMWQGRRLKNQAIENFQKHIEELNKSQEQKAIKELESIKQICEEEFNYWEYDAGVKYPDEKYSFLDISNAILTIQTKVEDAINKLKKAKEDAKTP